MTKDIKWNSFTIENIGKQGCQNITLYFFFTAKTFFFNIFFLHGLLFVYWSNMYRICRCSLNLYRTSEIWPSRADSASERVKRMVATRASFLYHPGIRNSDENPITHDIIVMIRVGTGAVFILLTRSHDLFWVSHWFLSVFNQSYGFRNTYNRNWFLKETLNSIWD